MTYEILIYVALAVGGLLSLSFLIAHTKNQENSIVWTLVMLMFCAVLLFSLRVTDLTFQWVLIETSTLFGALLVASNGSSKSVEAAWKFLLLNSYGLGIAFIGLILISFGNQNAISMDSTVLLATIGAHDNFIVQIGLWLAIFGYSAKLGLFPNLFWVGDTYAESSSQISGLIAAFIPVAVSFALRPLLEMDAMLSPKFIKPSNVFLISGIITILYSIWTVYQLQDVRRMTAKVALFHSGAIAVFLWFRPSNEIFFFLQAVNLALKGFLFSSLGILRMDGGHRFLDQILGGRGIHRFTTFLMLAAVCAAFTLPISPVFFTDLLLVKLGLDNGYFWPLVVPGLGLIFFAVIFGRLLPLLNLPHRKVYKDIRNNVNIRFVITTVLLFILIALGFLGFWGLTQGGWIHG
ncbi:hypothetical protein CH373_03230 [Leptospira perolatii]|uniref:Formate hydrogenase n=1 Tax=Leptospira perolatii TaxID=2023191 RepID=A0A2M9ZSJ7_9LEPT|nr:formate hydrogenase [Leptospira perolatii]PJZ71513.1 hypothetical protein CH360_03225 [Leptospira perolatii]PJZ75046.1 hypothetical protein CH373_03230 [Leptospira perolatii]